MLITKAFETEQKGIEDSKEEKQETVINNREENNKRANELAISKYKEYEDSLSQYTLPSNELEIQLDDMTIPKYVTLGELEDIGIYTDVLDKELYPYGEAYGDMLVYEQLEIPYHCLNITKSTKKTRDCYLSQYTLDNSVKVIVGDSLIEIGESLKNITEILNNRGYNLKYESIDEYSNKIKVNQSDWKIDIKVAEELDIGIAVNEYELQGTQEDGLKVVSYKLSITSIDFLRETYDKIAT